MIIFFALTIILLATDLVTKALIDGAPREVIKGLISFNPQRNSGASFGILQNAQTFFIIITIITLIVMLTFYFWQKPTTFASVAFAFFIAGTLGNFYDRLFISGGVRDFIKFEFISFPVFNVADICLNIGVVLLSIYFIFFYDKKKVITDAK